MRRATVLAALTLAAAAGCESSGAPATTADASAGRRVFSTACSGCHSLSGHNSPSRQGGDLLRVQLPRTVALQYTREMPVQRKLSRAQLNSVVDYILAVQQRRG